MIQSRERKTWEHEARVIDQWVWGRVEVNRADSCFQSMKAILGERNETYPLKLQKTEAESMNVAPLCSIGEGPISLNQWFLFF